jgi:hypothetical protein
VRARLLRDYQAQYPDPIEVRTGDIVILGMKDSEFPGWIWATSTVSEKSGWIPEEFLTTDDDRGTARRDYSAKELSVSEGQMVDVVEELLGWALVEVEPGRRGWVPIGHLARSGSPTDLPL